MAGFQMSTEDLLVNVALTVEATTGSTVTVPCTTPPIPIFDALIVTGDNTIEPGTVGERELDVNVKEVVH
jgi:hypothetical protein